MWRERSDPDIATGLKRMQNVFVNLKKIGKGCGKSWWDRGNDDNDPEEEGGGGDGKYV